MAIKIGRTILALLTLAAASTVANAVPPGGPAVCDLEGIYDGNFDGRFYKVVAAPGFSWGQAQEAAEALALPEEADLPAGTQGNLATINSHAEDEYIHCLIHSTGGAVATGESWVGASQEACDAEPGCGWRWNNGEEIAAENTLVPYTNWQDDEPNDLDHDEDEVDDDGSEQYGAVNLGGDFGMNDEGNDNNIKSYVVEFGDVLAPIPAGTCASSVPGLGCPLGEGGPLIKYPAQAVVSGDVEVRTWRFTDDPARCGVSQLNLGELVPGDGELIIAPYLCSTFGEITVWRTESSVQVPTGIVQITGTNKYGTANPVYPNDPTDQGIVVFRNNIDSEQLETADEMGVDPLFLGNVAETTNAVINPPRGAGNKGTYVFDGLRVHFDLDLDYDYETYAEFIDTRMVALQRYKLEKALAAVKAAKPALKPVSWAALRVLADAALYFHNRGNYDVALLKVKLLLKLNDQLKYKVITDKNPYGEVAYRYLNARDIYERRLIPYN